VSIPTEAILLLTHGSPSSLEELPTFLSNVRGGRPVSDEVVAAYRERYMRIGGLSPLTEISMRIAGRLEIHTGLPVYAGTQHPAPSIADALEQAMRAGVEAATALCLTPYNSRMTVGGYRRRLDQALASTVRPPTVRFVESWHLEPAFLAGLDTTLREGLEQVPAHLRDGTHVIFSAHSLPERVLAQNDPYPDQLQATVRRLVARLGLQSAQWTLAYQSAPPTPEPWLGPSIEAVLEGLAERGGASILIAPIGFVADNVEILYDLDIEVKDQAQSLGLHYTRTPLLNDAPALIEALAAAVNITGDLRPA
jgi:protoporphyrin/coproporphyrin ferrochelatase